MVGGVSRKDNDNHTLTNDGESTVHTNEQNTQRSRTARTAHAQPLASKGLGYERNCAHI